MAENEPTVDNSPPIRHRRFLRCDLSEAQDISYVNKNTHRGDPKRRWIKFVNTREFQLFLGVLLILDVIVLIVTIFLDAHFPPCFAIEDNARCVFEGENASLSDPVLQCLTDENKGLETAHKYLYFTSVAILVIFEVELFFLGYILGCYGFFRNFGYPLDFTIITTSLVLEIYLHETESGGAVGLLIIARLWRFVRISHGILFASQKRRREVAELMIGSVYGSEYSIGARIKGDFGDEFDGIDPEDDGEDRESN